MNTTSLEVLFLDLNGTTIDDWYASCAGANACLAAYGAAPITCEEYVRAVAGDGDYKKFYQDRGIYASRETLYDIFLPVYTAAVGNFAAVHVFPEVFETLDSLRDYGVEVHILTAARGDLVDRIIDAIGIREHCHNIHAHIHDKESQIRAVLGGVIDPKRCAMMGDIPADVTHAQAAGVRGVRFVNRDVPDDLFAGVTPDFTAFDFSDLLALV